MRVNVCVLLGGQEARITVLSFKGGAKLTNDTLAPIHFLALGLPRKRSQKSRTAASARGCVCVHVQGRAQHSFALTSIRNERAWRNMASRSAEGGLV